MHILSVCPVLACTGYIYRHNAALRVLCYHIRHSLKIDVTPRPYLSGEIESVVDKKNAKIYWNFSISMSTQGQLNRPEILLFDKDVKHLYIIEFSVPSPGGSLLVGTWLATTGS